MPRVVRLFQIKNLVKEDEADRIAKMLRSLDGVVHVQVDVNSGVLEIEYENAIIDRYVIREELLKIGFEMLI
ncbi:MAG: heavy-metal-associated domain-containing protein [Mesotoga sp.]